VPASKVSDGLPVALAMIRNLSNVPPSVLFPEHILESAASVLQLTPEPIHKLEPAVVSVK